MISRSHHWRIMIHTAAGRLSLGVWIAEENGRPVEVLLTGGGPMRIILDDLSAALSIGLKAPAPGFLREVCSSFRGRRDETAGEVEGDPLVTECSGIADYVARALSARYLDPPVSPAKEETA